MVQQYRLETRKRNEKGKCVNRRLRKNGFIPAVYYDKEGSNIPLTIPYGTFESIYARAQQSNIIELEIQQDSEITKKPVLIWDIHEHPVKNLILHVDFLGVDLKKEMTVDVGVEVSGKAVGVENGGVVSIFRDTITVKCLPTAIPDSIVVDVTSLDINDHIYINDIELPEGVKLIETEENFAIVGIAPPEATIEEEIEAEAEEESLSEEEAE